MDSDRVATVRRLFELFNEGVDDVPTDLVSPEVEFESPLSEIRGRPYRGYDDARQWFRDVTEQFGRWRYEIGEVRAEGETVIAVGKVHVEGRASGVELDPEVRWVFHFADDGRISRAEVFTRRAGRG